MKGGHLLLVDKPVGPTSHDVVSRARRALRERRIGHTGTLDPFASGLVILCVGPATRLAEYFSGMAKAYDATLRLGVSTTTLDPEGEVVEEFEVPDSLDAQAVETAAAPFRGDIEQRPPAFSAKKQGGERAYEKARRGEVVELEPVPVTVHEFRIDRVEPPEVDFHAEVSSGTYIRTLGHDLGSALGVGGHLTALRRTAVGTITIDRAVTLEELIEWAGDPPADHPAFLRPLEGLSHLPVEEAGPEQMRLLTHGRSLEWAGDDTAVAMIRSGDDLLAVGAASEGIFRPRKVFVTPEDLDAEAPS